VSNAVQTATDATVSRALSSGTLVEPSPCILPIRNLWRRAGKMGLNRAVANVIVQRLRPDLADHMPWPLETSAMGRPQLCFIYPTIPPQGHWFTLATGSCRDIANADAHQSSLSPEQRSEVILMAVWRPQRAGADRRVHVWAIPARIVALMSKRLDGPEVANRNVGIEPPVAGKPSVWRKGKSDSGPISLQDFYRCWTFSDGELAYVQDAERNEIRPPRATRTPT